MKTSQRSKAVGLCLLVLALSGFLTACSVGEKQRALYDDEGQFVKTGDSYSFFRKNGEIDERQMALSCQRFYGMQTVWEVNAEEEGLLKVNYDCQLKRGKLKVVVITPELDVMHLFEQCGKGSREITLSEGKYVVRIVGKNANGKVSMQLEHGENVSIGVSANDWEQ